MRHEPTSKHWTQDLENQFGNIIHSEPTLQIKMRGVCSGQSHFERINKDCWRDEVFRRGYELIWGDRGFELVGD